MSFLFACVTDHRTCEVYNVTWWVSGAAALLLLCLNGLNGRMPATVLTELAFFCMLQLFAFSGMYGRADCYAFCVCALAETACGLGLLEYLYHMLLSFCLLAVVQLLRRNINAKGNLKCPVAFIPYISVAFALVLLFFSAF